MNTKDNKILPLPEGLKRPLWSVMIPTYNPGKYFYDAIESVLIQEIPEEKMQIEVVDDCSDKVDVEKLVNDYWKGRVKYYRQPQNVGHSFNFTESVRRSRGELVHILHDDDRVLPEFYSTFEQIFNEYENIGAAFCRQRYIDEEGKLLFHSEPEMESRGLLEDAVVKLAQMQRIQYCAMVVRRKAYEELGGFVLKNIGCEDWEMWVRIASKFPVAYEPKDLAEYRVHHGTSMTLKDMRSGQDMRFMREAISIFREYVPKERRKETDAFRNVHYGKYSFWNGYKLLDEHKDEAGAAAQWNETIVFDPEVVYKNIKLVENISFPIHNLGISVIADCRKNEDVIKDTLNHIALQKVPGYIPWEVILVTNKSEAEKLQSLDVLKIFDEKQIKYRFVEIESSGEFEYISKAAENSGYNFIVFFNSGDLPGTNYIAQASFNMLRDRKMGALGGYTEAIPEAGKLPFWVNKWKDIYEAGEQFEYTNVLTWTKGFVWNSGMVIRKDAWLDITGKDNFQFGNPGNFKPDFRKQLGRALRDSGYNTWYSTDLRMKKLIRSDDIKWRNFKSKWKHWKLDEFFSRHSEEKPAEKTGDTGEKRDSFVSRKRAVEKTYRNLKRYKRRKLIEFTEVSQYDEDVLNIELNLELLKIQLGREGSYSGKLRLIKRIASKRDFKILSKIFTKRYFGYPRYLSRSSKRGVSVILNYTNSSYHYLTRSLSQLSKQRVPEKFPWEVIIVSNFIKDEIKDKLISLWKESNAGARLNFHFRSHHDESTAADDSLRYTHFDKLIFINEFDLLQPDYVRLSDAIFEKNEYAAVAGGQTHETSEVRLPKWFKQYRSLYGIGSIGDFPEEISVQKRRLWKSGVAVRRDFFMKVSEQLTANSENVLSETDDLHENILSSHAGKFGMKILYNPRLVVDHLIPVEKLNWEFLKKLHYRNGAAKVLESLTTKDSLRDSWTISFNKTLGEFKKYPLRKIFLKNSRKMTDTESLEIESLKGRFNELLKSRREYLKTYSELNTVPVENGRNGVHENGNVKKTYKGVSIVICCYNSSRVIGKTLSHISRQKVPDTIPWEVIIVDNASTDGTGRIAEDFWSRHNCLAPIRVIREPKPGLTAARMKGINSARYEYVIFCDDDNWLCEDFVKDSFEIMNEDESIGILGGRSKAVFETDPPEWFNFWKDSYAVGNQSKEKTEDVTHTRGYLWGAAMVIRKSAMKKLWSKGFKSVLTDRKGNVLSAGGDTELCYALRNEGWKLLYDSRLRFKHFITRERLDWKYVGKLFTGFGQASVGLDYYLEKYESPASRKSKKYRRQGLQSKLRGIIRKLRETNYEKLLLKSIPFEGDTDFPMIEYCVGRLEGLLKKRKSYNRALHLLKKTASKNDLLILTPSFRDYYGKFPRYKFEKKYNGVSVIVCTYNGESRLPDTIRHLALQKVDKSILWEVILVDNASTDNSKEAAINEWKKHKCKAKLRIIDQPVPGKQLALEKGYEVASYEYLVTCDDDNWLEENFVQYVFEVMHGNKNIGVLGGPNDALCEVEPPEWFRYFQKDYAAGEQGDIYNGSVSNGNITWKRGFVWGAGMVVRKSAWEKLIQDGFRTSMSCRKGEELSSGGDSEACYALVLAGWQVWYDPRLKLKHCMPAGRLDWKYLIRLFKGFGIASVGLEIYEKAIKLGRADVDEEETRKQGWKYEVKRTIREIRKYGIRKLFSLRFPQDNNTDIVMLEFYISRLRELLRMRKEYDEKFLQLQNAPWKKSYAELRRAHRESVEKEIDIRYGWPWSNECATIPPANSDQKTFPMISVLTPSFNSSGTIEKAIMSVVMQRYPNFEHIIYDGGSQDSTVDILRRYPHLKWISEKDKGQSDAMNKAFAKSKGEIIVYLNADDYFQRGAFFKIADAFERNPEADMIVGNLLFDYLDHTFTRKPEIEYKKIMQPFKYMFPINPVSYFYKRKIQEEIGEFPLDNHMTMDYWFLLRAYQKYKLVKIEDYLGTFFMNGLNKTSTADNRKNTHVRVVHHCSNYDRKLLPFYLYNYYKFFYYEKKPYNLKRLSYLIRKNIRRGVSLLTLRKNKHYSHRMYMTGRYRYFENKRIRSAAFILSSFILYPKAVRKKERMNILMQSLLPGGAYEKTMNAYRFIAYPPGMPMAHKLQYYGNEFRNSGKGAKGSFLLILAVLLTPAKLLGKRKKSSDKSFSRGSASLFNSAERKEYSYNLYIKAQEKYYFHRNFQAIALLLYSFMLNPKSAFRRSRLNFLSYAALGKGFSDDLKVLYHLYKDNPELTLPHKLNYYGNRLRKEHHAVRGNSILVLTYLLSPKYIFKREKIDRSKIIFASQIQAPKKFAPSKGINVRSRYIGYKNHLRYNANPLTLTGNLASQTAYRFKSAYHYFRYRKFKARSKDLYAEAIECYANNKRSKAFSLLMRSYLLYPLSVKSKNKLGLTVNTLLGNSLAAKFENVFK